MWLSKQAARRQTGEKASVSPVTIGGAEAGVLSGAEVRQTQCFLPAVISGGRRRERACLF